MKRKKKSNRATRVSGTPVTFNLEQGIEQVEFVGDELDDLGINLRDAVVDWLVGHKLEDVFVRHEDETLSLRVLLVDKTMMLVNELEECMQEHHLHRVTEKDA